MDMRLTSLILILLAGTAWAAADFDRYQVILTRMPFGTEPVPPPPGPPPGTVPVPPAVDFTKTLKMCAITKNDLTGKVQVGLVDLASKKNYFLTVGDTEDDITLVEADYENEKARLSKGGDERSIAMSDAKTMAPVPPAVVTAPGVFGGMRPPPSLPTLGAPFATTNAPAGPELLHRERLEPKLTGEALKQHLRQYQMDLIRAGGKKGPALPMQLTPEMDAQLVTEGVLPPQ